MFVDSHCHLEMESFDPDRDAVIAACLQEGIEYMLTIGTEEAYLDKVVEIIDKYPAIYGAMGIHPHSAPQFTDDLADRLRAYAKHPKLVAYGEIGLDFFKNYAPEEIQVKAFREQLLLAQELRLPVIVHSRSAPSQTLAILEECYKNGAGGVIHCYSYDLDYARRFLDIGMHISIPGTITYRNAGDLKRVVEYVPGDRLLAETDAPFLTPEPHRGKRNVPYFVKLTIEKMAAIRGETSAELAATIGDNFVRLFLQNKGEQA